MRDLILKQHVPLLILLYYVVLIQQFILSLSFVASQPKRQKHSFIVPPLFVSEHHIKQYRFTKQHFILTQDERNEINGANNAAVQIRLKCLSPLLVGEYDAIVPMTKHGLLMNVGEVDGSVAFLGYRQFPDGTKGPAEINNIIKSLGDRIISVDGISTVGKTFKQVIVLLKGNGKNKVGSGGSATTLSATATAIATIPEVACDKSQYTSIIPYQNSHLLHKTHAPIFTSAECQSIVNEAERVTAEIGWRKNRHGNFPSTDIPIVEAPETLKFLRQALVQRIYPLLRLQFGEYIPDLNRLRVADGFIVKYDADGGQAELKPHRDGAVLSFNIALNPASDFEGGGTWFNSLNDAVKIDEGEMITHASGLLHGGQAITSGKRYIMVGFVIVEDYNAWSMRFYKDVRNF